LQVVADLLIAAAELLGEEPFHDSVLTQPVFGPRLAIAFVPKVRVGRHLAELTAINDGLGVGE